MHRSERFGFGLLVVTGCLSVGGCTSDEPAAAGGSDAAAGTTGTGGSAGKGTGGRAATGGRASGGAGGAATGGSSGSSSGGAATGGASAGGAGTGGSSAGGAAGDASMPDGSNSGGTTGDAGTDASSGGTAGSDSSAGGASTGGAVATGGAANDGAPSVASCGSSPYARLWIGSGTLLNHPTGPISVSGTNCSGNVLSLTPKTPASNPGQTAVDAQFLDVPDKTPFHLRATQTGSFPFLTQELTPDKDSIVAQAFGYAAPLNAYMIATDSGFDALDPSWNPSTRAMLLLQIAPLPGATGSCANIAGITITVDGHTEATGINGATPIVSTTGSNGNIVFVTTTGTSLAAELLTLTVSKSGCTVKTTGYDASPGIQTSFTGKFPVEAGATTWGTIAIAN